MLSNDAPPPPLGGFGSPADGFGPPPPEPPPPISRAAVASVALGLLVVPGCVCGPGVLAMGAAGLASGVLALRQPGARSNVWVAWIGIVINAIPLFVSALLVALDVLRFAARPIDF
jgi:hypothetical protein